MRKLCLIGAAGGVGQALIGLFCRHNIGLDFIKTFESVILIDASMPSSFNMINELPVPFSCEWYESIDSKQTLNRLIERYCPALIIEAADIETRDFIEVCCERNVDFICSGYGINPDTYTNTPDDPRTSILYRAQELLSQNHNYSPRLSKCLVGCGMNPGVVNAIVVDIVSKLYGNMEDIVKDSVAKITFVEHETFTEASPSKNSMVMTWNPLHAFWEFTEKDTGYCINGKPIKIERSPCHTIEKAPMEHSNIAGMVVPHEEVVTISSLFPSAEVKFVYSIPERIIEYLKNSCHLEIPECHHLEKWPQSGYDYVGVYLELTDGRSYWSGYKNYHSEGKEFNTNATLLQVASGILAGAICLENKAPGIHLVEDLDCNHYLKIVDFILGERRILNYQEYEKDEEFVWV